KLDGEVGRHLLGIPARFGFPGHLVVEIFEVELKLLEFLLQGRSGNLGLAKLFIDLAVLLLEPRLLLLESIDLATGALTSPRRRPSNFQALMLQLVEEGTVVIFRRGKAAL